MVLLIAVSFDAKRTRELREFRQCTPPFYFALRSSLKSAFVSEDQASRSDSILGRITE
jgi:hypothetical protein